LLEHANKQPVEKLSKERPQHNIFNMYIIGSVMSQFAIHIATLIYVTQYVKSVEPMEKVVDLEKEFKPSLLNSAVYLLQLIQQISTFAINYQGRPFRESIRENRAMYWGLLVTGGVAFAGAMETFPDINVQLKLVPFTDEFKFLLTSTMALDYVGCWLCEKGFKHFFSDYKPKPIAERRPDQLEREQKRIEAAAEAEQKRIEAAAEAEREAIIRKVEEKAGRRRL